MCVSSSSHTFCSHDPLSITTGQGEFILFRQDAVGNVTNLSESLFADVYRCLNTYSTVHLALADPQLARNRDQLIKRKIKEFDPELEAVFIPKTLYELIFIKELLEDDCKWEDSSCRKYSYSRGMKVMSPVDTKLTNLMRSIFLGGIKLRFLDPENNVHPDVIRMAYMVNAIAVDTLHPSRNGFTLSQIIENTHQILDYLRRYSDMGIAGDLGDLDIRTTGLSPFTRLNGSGNLLDTLPISFGRSEEYCQLRQTLSEESDSEESETALFELKTPCMAVSTDEHVRIITEVVKLECSPIAHSHLLIYRGGDFRKDSVVDLTFHVHTLSFGLGLFSGAVFDPTGAAWTFIRSDENDGYVIPIPFDRLRDGPFYLPKTSTLVQLFSIGEMSHPRTKVPDYSDPKDLKGIVIENLIDFKSAQIDGCIYAQEPQQWVQYQLAPLRSSSNGREIGSLFNEYKKKAIHLKQGRSQGFQLSLIGFAQKVLF